MSEFLSPRTLAEALKLRSAHPDFTVLSGGTDLMVRATERDYPVGTIDVFSLKEMRGVCESDAALSIGASTPYADLLRSDVVLTMLPNLHAAIREIGAVQIQERGTIGGNIGTSSPVGDTLPCLLALDAEVELRSQNNTRRVAYSDFCTGYRKTQLGADELITAIHIPRPAKGTRLFWRKIGTRRAQAISKVMGAASFRIEEGVVSHARIALGAVADRPRRVEAAEQRIQGEKPSERLATEVAAIVRSDVKPIDDVRSTASYRLDVAVNIVRRFVLELV